MKVWVVCESTYGAHESDPFTAVFSTKAKAERFVSLVEDRSSYGWKLGEILKVEIDPDVVNLWKEIAYKDFNNDYIVVKR